jgi:hypothetical protein
VLHAVEKLIALGDQLPYPHSSGVHGTKLRELRPRGGRSPWRAFYRRVGNQMIIGAIGPEAEVDPAEFRKAVAKAEARIASVEEQENMNDDDNTTNRRRGAR